MANKLQDAVRIVKQTVLQLGDAKLIADACDQVAGFAAHADEIKATIEGLKAEAAALATKVSDAQKALDATLSQKVQATREKDAVLRETTALKAELDALKKRIGAV